MAAPDRTVRDITGLLNRAGHVLSTRLATALAEVGLTPRMHGVLVHALAAERTQIQLAALADLDKTTMVGTIDDLERRGLAERRPSATDRRARIITVTDKGRAAAEDGQKLVDRVHREALTAFAPADRAVFVEVLSDLVDRSAPTGPSGDPRPPPAAGPSVRGSTSAGNRSPAARFPGGAWRPATTRRPGRPR